MNFIVHIRYSDGNVYIRTDNANPEPWVCTIEDFTELQMMVHNYLNHPESEFEISYSGRNFDPEWIGFGINGVQFKIKDISGTYNHETETCLPLGMLAISTANDIVKRILEDNYSMPIIILPKNFKLTKV